MRKAVIAFLATTFAGSFAAVGLSARGDAAASCAHALKPLVIQVGFADIQRSPKRAFVEKRFLIESDRYIREMSYGKTCLAGTITGKRYRLPGSIKQYYVPWQNLKVDKRKLKRLVSDTITQVERDYDVSKFDFIVFALTANAREWGNQGLNTYPGLLGWKDESSLVTPSGRKIKGGIAIYALSADLSKVFHNIAHIIGGVRNGRRVLPDMYDQDSASASKLAAGAGVIKAHERSELSMGAWDPMSCGMCKQLPDAPGLTSWSKLRLGWLDKAKVRTVEPGENVYVTLGALEDGSTATLAVRIPLTPTTYYLVENREKIGHDRNLPASGVLIMYADDKIPEPRFGKAPVRLVNADPSAANLDRAAFDIGGKAAFSDPRHRLKIRLLRKSGAAYEINIERGAR
jgi:M6 family metalloprotease-like protein